MAISPPSIIELGKSKFVIMDAPNDDNLPAYIVELKKHNVGTIVRVCDPTYETDGLAAEGIKVEEMPFPDGDAPPAEVVSKWLELVEAHSKGGQAIAVHCVAGLGRAPVLVAIALIEKKMDPLEAVTMIRSKRRGAINTKQLAFVEQYKPKGKDCIVM
eukprot:GFYU01001062.1.p1 GENE.GFYU01001062.1~~GFYU01001062.1.p1  ORF type:complete len:158 (+),score=54.71 GFYU01001062.1:943-1416(+)